MYPQDIDKFTEKLNKLNNNTYVIEEEINIVDGMYEGQLEHDNVSLPSISVWTGSKFTGENVRNFIISTPSKTPWRKSIKIFSDASKVYVTYETQGDTVEADDINKVQDSIVSTQTELERYKGANDDEVTNLKNRTTNLENTKANKTYVDTELNKKADKVNTYTKDETDQRIQNVIGTAPSNLDTLQELAQALNDDANFASTVTNQLASKVDKVAGKQLSTEDYTTTEKNKLAGVQDNANNYVHPPTHSATMITEDTTHRFSTDIEKSNWNDANSKKHTHNNLTLLETITQALVDTWNSAYNHVADIARHITSDERNLWNTVSNKVDKVTGKGLSTNDFDNNYKLKLDGISTGANKVETSSTNGNIKIDSVEKTVYTHPSGTNPHGTTKADLGLENVENKSSAAIRSEITSSNITTALGYIPINKAGDTVIGRLVITPGTTGGIAFPNDAFGGSGDSATITLQNPNGSEATEMTFTMTNDTNDIVHFKVPSIDGVKINGNKAWNAGNFNPDAKSDIGHTHDDRYYTESEADSKFATKTEISNAGYGDMLKSSYDTNGDGIIDNADKLDGKHASDFQLNMNLGSKTASDLPSTWPNGIYYSTIYNNGYPCSYGTLLTIKGTSGSSITQICQSWPGNDGGESEIWVRAKRDTGADIWGAWRKIWGENNFNPNNYISKGPVTWNTLKGV
ncbi:hypothetical protein [Clostridium sp. DJ247]|uniref:hypothetical protein n=1 Tax=Clostridium sp. DJ247 TaxID=2726188 RepID=UPI001623B7AD|nr:hypothetical protein [Clostridium sp. DJ247]